MNPLQDAMNAVRRTPTDPEVWLALGALLVAEGQPERARDCFERALLLDPANDEARRALRALDGVADDAAAPLDGAGMDEPDPLDGIDDFEDFPPFDAFDAFDDLDEDEPGFRLEEDFADGRAAGGAEARRSAPLSGAARLWAGLGLVGLGAFVCLCALILMIALFLRG